MTQATKTRKQTEIQAATINRVSDKSGKFLGYLVKSNSSENYYQVTYNTSANRYECGCVATCKCCHIKAVEQVQAARVEIAKQQVSTPAATTDERHRVSRVDGLRTRWYPEYRQGAEWFRYPEPDGNRAVSFVIEGRAEAWLAERLAAVAEQAAEAKMDAFKAAMDEQYASDPRRGLSQGEVEAAQSYMRHYDDRY